MDGKSLSMRSGSVFLLLEGDIWWVVPQSTSFVLRCWRQLLNQTCHNPHKSYDGSFSRIYNYQNVNKCLVVTKPSIIAKAVLRYSKELKTLLAIVLVDLCSVRLTGTATVWKDNKCFYSTFYGLLMGRCGLLLGNSLRHKFIKLPSVTASSHRIGYG